MTKISQSQTNTADARTLQAADDALSGRSKGRIARFLPFLGPAFIASVAYVDPGNFATNIDGGARFGYMLLWVIWASNIMAMLLQTLAAKLGIATGCNLAELCRMNYPRPAVYSLWVLMEIVAMATDLAEFLGAALGMNLLLSIPMPAAGVLTAIVTFVILGLQRRGFRPLEIVITVLIGVVALCYLIETAIGRPDWSAVLYHSVHPQFSGPESIILAAGILGATVMPHAIFLHSSLTQSRIKVQQPEQLRTLFHFEILDVIAAMGVAGFVNAAMLVMAASTFHRYNLTDVNTIQQAHHTLQPLLGAAAKYVFAISLLAAGLSSSAVGTMAGQVMMQGFIRRHIPIYVRRGVTILPAVVVIALGLEPTRVLVLSQVVLSFGLPFAVIPLIQFTRRRSLMGTLTNARATTAAACVAAVVILSLNVYLLYQTFFGG